MKKFRSPKIPALLLILLLFNPANIITKSIKLVNGLPINDNLLNILQNVDQESNLSNNTKKIDFKLFINPVGTDGNELTHYLKLKSALWLTNDEFTSLKNYLGDSDLSNALKILRRKFHRRYESQNLAKDSLKYQLLSALAFSSLQGKINVLKNGLNEQKPELLLLVSGYVSDHRSALDWKPLELDDSEFSFKVDTGNRPTTDQTPVTVTSEYDSSEYQRLIFDSIKLLDGSNTSTAPDESEQKSTKPEESTETQDSKQLSAQQETTPTEDSKPTIPEETEDSKQESTKQEESTPKVTEEPTVPEKSEQPAEPTKQEESTPKVTEEPTVPEKSEQQPAEPTVPGESTPTPIEQPNKQEETNKQPEESTTMESTSVNSVTPSSTPDTPEQTEESKQETTQQPEEAAQQPEPTVPGESTVPDLSKEESSVEKDQSVTNSDNTSKVKDSEVVDKENPALTEETKSLQDQNPPDKTDNTPNSVNNSSENIENSDNSKELSDNEKTLKKGPPNSPADSTAANTDVSSDEMTDKLTNVVKKDGTNLKTTFTLGSDDASATKFHKSKNASSESGDESTSETASESEGGEKSNEDLLTELQKTHPPYNETELMNILQKVDTEDVNPSFKSPLTITLKIDFFSSDKRIHVPVVTSASLLLPETLFTMCLRDELTQQCAFELKDRLMARFEDEKSQAFKWAHLVSLLQALSLQGDVFIENYNMVSGSESKITISKREMIMPMKSLAFLNQLEGEASSTNQEAKISFKLHKGVLNIPVGISPTDIGQNYGVHAQLTRFLELYGDFEITHSLFDLPTQKRNKQEKSGKTGTSRTGKEEPSKVYTMDELLSMNIETKDLNNNIHYILSGYERALFSVPKRLSGYKLVWETVDKHPELQRLWIEALTLMKLMDKSDNLKNFLNNHTFKYQELKDLFEITYGIIAADNFDEARDFYETVGITQKDVDMNLGRVRSLFFAKTGTNVTRLPPTLKPMHPNCLINNMITSLSSYDLIERLQVMYVQWINRYKNSTDDINYDLAFLCAGSSVLLQHWHYFQLDQRFHDQPVPFITLITSFSRLAQGKYKNPERKQEIKDLINSKVAKQCRKYINAAGILATSPYKTATINMQPKSLLGAIGNALSVSMDAPALEVAYAMKDYFKAELSKGKFGNSLGICLGLQLLYRLNGCLSIERSNDFSLYSHNLLTMDTRDILEKYTQIDANTKNINKYHQYLKFGCDPDNVTVHEALSKLMSLVSTQSHLDLMDELVRREMLSPDFTPEGYLAEPPEGSAKSDVVDLEDDTTTLLEAFDSTNARSLLEIANDIEEGSDDSDFQEASESFIQLDPSYTNNPYTTEGYVYNVSNIGIPNFKEMDNLYQQLLNTNLHGFTSLNKGFNTINKLFNSTDSSGNHPKSHNQSSHNKSGDKTFGGIMFDIRMERLDSRDDLIALDVPFTFHEKELDFIESLESKSLLKLLMYRMKKRVESLTNLYSSHEKPNGSGVLFLDELVAKANVDISTYESLLHIFELMPEDGYYFEYEGLVIPDDRVGKLTAKHIYKSLKHSNKANDKNIPPSGLVLQVIDPVDDRGIKELTMPKEHIKKHDELFYQKMTEL
uniref:Uncharacterized protein n=1 Tax=Theileria annulata TaxID=5874 RepID=A0A3B0MX82_THEAN